MTLKMATVFGVLLFKSLLSSFLVLNTLPYASQVCAAGLEEGVV